jgi:integrase
MSSFIRYGSHMTADGRRTERIKQRITAGGETRYDVRVRIAGQQVEKTFVRKKDATAWLNQTLVDAQTGVAVVPSKGKETFEAYFTRWMARGGTRGNFAPKTRALYEDLYRLHLAPTFASKALGSIRPDTVADWFGVKRQDKPLMAAKSYRLLSTVMKSAVKDKLIGFNPCQVDGAGQEHTAERPLIGADDARDLADTIAPPLRALVLTATFGQLRLGELLGLHVTDIDLGGHRIHVERQAVEVRGVRTVTAPKTKAGVRPVNVPPALSIELAAHIDAFCPQDVPQPRWLFATMTGRPYYRWETSEAWVAARAAVNEKRAEAGLPGIPPNLHLHDLRHAGLTLVAQGGATVKELMRRGGHASPAAALRYQHAAESRDQEIANQLDSLMTSKRSDSGGQVRPVSAEGSVRDGGRIRKL